MTAPRAPHRCALVVAHPGHELMVYGWMETARPHYFCLTDGSGGNATSRMASTSRLLASAGAEPGPVYGRFADKEAYRLLLTGHVEVFGDLVEEIAQALVDANVEIVAGDAAEGFNPTHDLCRFLIDGAVERVRHLTGRALRNYEFLLDSRPDAGPRSQYGDAIWLHLEPDAIERKVAAALAYAELRSEVEAALERFGREVYAVECLRPSTTSSMQARFESEPPLYEQSGEMRVEQGLYREVLRYRQHMLPALEAIARRANGG